MKDGYRILSGTAKEVETELNNLHTDWYVMICGFTATNDLTTALIEITKRDIKS